MNFIPSRKFLRRAGRALSACAILLSLLQPAQATLVLDFRFDNGTNAFDGTTSRNVSQDAVGTVYTINAIAVVTGSDGITSNDGLQALYWGAQTSIPAAGFFTGTVTTSSGVLGPAFNAAGNQLPTYQDSTLSTYGQDGKTDATGNSLSTNTGFFRSTAGSGNFATTGSSLGTTFRAVGANTVEFLVGKFTVTSDFLAASLPATSTTAFKLNPVFPSTLLASTRATWQQDGVQGNAGTATLGGYSMGSSVSFSVAQPYFGISFTQSNFTTPRQMVSPSAQQYGSTSIVNGSASAANFTAGVTGSVVLQPGNPTSINGGATLSYGIGVNNSTVGTKTGTVTLTNTSNPSDTGDIKSINVTGDVLADRVVTASTVNLGRVMQGLAVSASGNLTLSSLGADNINTRITVTNGGIDSLGSGMTVSGGLPASAFNGTFTSDTRTLSGANFASTGNKVGTVTLANAAAEGTGNQALSGQTPGNTVVSYSATAVQNRVVSVNSVAFGRVMTNVTVIGSNNITLTSLGADIDNTRIKVANGGPGSAGFSVSGGSPASAFDGTFTSDTRTLSGGTFTTSGSKSGTITLTNSGAEGAGSSTLAGQTPGTTSVNYSATALNNRIITSNTVSLGRVMVNVPVGSAAVTLSSAGSDSVNTRIRTANGSADSLVSGFTVSGGNPSSAFDGTFTSDSRTLSGGLFSTSGSKSGTVTLSNSSAEGSGSDLLTGQVPGSTSVSYIGTAVIPRAVTAANVDLGLQHAGASLSGTNFTANLSTSGADSQFTRVTVQGSAVAFDGTSGAGTNQSRSLPGPSVVGSSGTLASLTVNGEGLTGEGAYSNLVVPYTSTLFSGTAVWASNASGSWGTATNWNDASVPTVHAAPGTFANFDNFDTAAFNGTGTGNTISLNGTSPSLKSLSFSGSTNYVIAQGSSGSIKLKSDTGIATLSATGTATHTISAPITGTDVVSKTGNGTVVLTGANTYSGETSVDGGTLIIKGTSQSANLTANNTGTLRIDGTNISLTTGSLRANSGGAIEYNNATINGGFIRGAGTQTILAAGTNSFTGVTALNGSVIQQNGPTNLINFTNGGTWTNAATLNWDGGVISSSGKLFVNQTVNAQDLETNGVVQINNGGVLNHGSSSNLVAGGGSRTTINTGGQLVLQGGREFDLNGALLVNNGTISGNTNVYFGSLAKGSGIYGGVNVYQGGAYSPGNSPGTSNTGATSWNTGGKYTWEINKLDDLIGAAEVGNNPGWDYWNMSSLNVTGSFTIELHSIALANDNPASLVNWDGHSNNQWLIASSANAAFTPSALSNLLIDGTAFSSQNNLFGGQFSLTAGNGNSDLFLNFTAVPEPSTLALGCCGLIGLVILLRRRRSAVQ